jgi:type III secretion protein C
LRKIAIMNSLLLPHFKKINFKRTRMTCFNLLSFKTLRRSAGLMVCAGLLAVQLAHAAPIPNAQRSVQLSAREQPIAAFLQDLCGLIDVPVSVSAAVKGAVNGNFNGPAETVTRTVSRAFGLVTYYDGAVMHVYAANEMQARTLPTTAAVAERVMRMATEMRMTDPRNTLRTTRDGAVIASGTPRFIEQVEEAVRASQVTQANHSSQVSSTTLPPLGFKVFYLRYAWAQDVTVNFGGRQMVVPGVASIVRSLVTSSPRSPVSMVAQEQQLRPTQPSLKGQGLGGRGQPVLGVSSQPGNNGANGGAVASTANGAGNTADVLMAAYGPGSPGGAPAVPAAYNNNNGSSGEGQQVRIEADTRLNAIIVRDAPERLQFYEQLIASLDVEPQSLEIEATIIDVNTDRMRELGINWRGNYGKSSVLFGNGTASDTLLQPRGGVVGSAISPTAGTVGGLSGGVISAVIGDASQFVARMSAMQSDGAARVVSSPQVVTLSNVEAIFDSSSTFHVRVAGRDQVDLFNVSAGTTLRVTPHVFKDNNGVRIKLLVNLETGSLSDQSVDAIPVVDRSSINTQALIYEGESLLIGGLTQESSRKGTSKVPLLGDIPLIGNLFKYRKDSDGRIERMFLISPRLSANRSSSMGPKPAAAVPAAAASAVAAPAVSVAVPVATPVTSPPPLLEIVPLEPKSAAVVSVPTPAVVQSKPVVKEPEVLGLNGPTATGPVRPTAVAPVVMAKVPAAVTTAIAPPPVAVPPAVVPPVAIRSTPALATPVSVPISSPSNGTFSGPGAH